MRTPQITLATSLLLLGLPLAAFTAPASERDLSFFEAKVRPVLAKRCFSCHGPKIAQASLRLDTAQGLKHGGDGGAVVVPGKPDDSRLIQALRYDNARLKMPPSGKLPDAEIEVLTEWLRRGAVFPETGSGAIKRGPMSMDDGKRFWAFRPLQRTEPAPVKQKTWPVRRIDSYVLARLEKTGLHPSPRADRRTLIRRVSFDLLGLPPTPEEVEAFVKDPAPDAYEKLVERLLASPHYGERWARHWLDLGRYCDVPEEWVRTESEGQPWLYRDWVVQALNQDVPYDRFVRLQLAADEIPGTPPKDLAALGFLGLSPVLWKELKLAPEVVKTVVAEEWEERINTIGGSLLGMTVACARCHDHKFDPISQQDYYALAGILASTKLTTRPLCPDGEVKTVLEARAKVKALDAEARALDAAKKPGAAEMRAQAEVLKKSTADFDAPMAYTVETAALQVVADGPNRTKLDWRMGKGQDEPLQMRGNPSKTGPTVPRHFLTVLSSGIPRVFTQGSGRRELADAIFTEGAPLAARVIVNRVWRHHFGRGLVETPSNFGTQGDRPSHPELLDDLASRFMQAGWSLKWLHREILLSSAYQQSAVSGQQSAKDPDNRLLWRMNRRRLEVEPWRDAILAAAGTLDSKIGGPSEPLDSLKNVRRTLYGTIARYDVNDLLRLYDFPDPASHCPARFDTTTPLQSLYVLNSPVIGAQAQALANRIRKEVAGDVAGQVRRAYLLLYSREPKPAEVEAARKFLGEESDAKWEQYAEVLLARNELMFVD